jgi:hypothetical protein
MRAIYKFVAGNSRVTPVGIAVAVALALSLRHLGWWCAVVYAGVLALTLAFSTREPVQ